MFKRRTNLSNLGIAVMEELDELERMVSSDSFTGWDFSYTSSSSVGIAAIVDSMSRCTWCLFVLFGLHSGLRFEISTFWGNSHIRHPVVTDVVRSHDDFQRGKLAYVLQKFLLVSIVFAHLESRGCSTTEFVISNCSNSERSANLPSFIIYI